MARISRKTIAVGVVSIAVGLLFAGAARAADPGVCINSIAAGGHRMIAAEDKALADCTKFFVKGLPVGRNILLCAQPFSSKLVKAMQILVRSTATAACEATPPDFGPSSVTAFADAALGASAALHTDLFGAAPNDTALRDLAGAKCQAELRKAISTCTDTRLGEFDKCIVSGFATGNIADAGGIAGCLGGTEQPDPKGKIRACSAKILQRTIPACVKSGVNLDLALAGCGTNDPAEANTCITERTRCRLCAYTNEVYGTSVDCDSYDDGNDLDESCAEPLLCGDGGRDGDEICDDGNNDDGDGCSATCTFEPGWSCTLGGAGGATTSCSPVPNDGLVVGDEVCDDGNSSDGDGCSSAGEIELGWACAGSPSVCLDGCGTGRLQLPQEQCDDGNNIPYDGCSPACQLELGWTCSGAPSTCSTWNVVIDSPAAGVFNAGATQTVTGHLTGGINPFRTSIRVNGAIVGTKSDGTFSTTIATDQANRFNPVRVTAADKIDGAVRQDRSTIVTGASVADGDYSPASIALRVNDTGLNRIEPYITSSLSSGLDLGTLLPPGTIVAQNTCFAELFGACISRGNVEIIAPPATLGSFAVDIDSQTNFAKANVRLNQVTLWARTTGGTACSPIKITATVANLNGNYTLDPDPFDPTFMDVNLSGSTAIDFLCPGPSNCAVPGGTVAPGATTYRLDPQCGGLNDFLITLVAGSTETTVKNALIDFLKDPDGTGPGDAFIAQAIEDALSGLSISSALGDSLGVKFQAPFTDIFEDAAGITFKSRSRVFTENGTGPGQCVPPPGAPDFARSVVTPSVYPTYSGTTPSGQAYDVGVGLSVDAFNQLLKSQVECGFLSLSLQELDLGTGPISLSTGLLGVIIPEFAALPPEIPVRISIKPLIAPVVTGDPGPNGNTTSLKISNVLVQIVQDDPTQRVLLSATFDATIGLNLAFGDAKVNIQLGSVSPEDISVSLIQNTVNVDPVLFETAILPQLVQLLLPQLAGDLTAFDLPSFLGFQLGGVGIVNSNKFFQIFANLNLP